MALNITTQLVMQAATARGWKAELYEGGKGLYTVSTLDGRKFFLKGMRSFKTGEVNGYIAGQKDIAQAIATELKIRTPATMQYKAMGQKETDFLKRHGRVVVKPVGGAHGLGVSVNIDTLPRLNRAVEIAAEYSQSILLQQQIAGDDYRLLMIGGELVAAAIRRPAFVIGDGVHTVEQLIKVENGSNRRGPGYQKSLSHIDSDSASEFLGDAMKSVPAKGEEMTVVGIANIGRGGVSIDVTRTVGDQLVKDAQKLTDYLDMGVCGVDFIVTEDNSHYFIEMNGAPSLGLHERPYSGSPQPVADAFLDWLVKTD